MRTKVNSTPTALYIVVLDLKCDRVNCDKSFKNVGDLTRHLKQHTSTKHKCPDCDYENVDLRNFESHRHRHSRITKYYCESCEEEFI